MHQCSSAIISDHHSEIGVPPVQLATWSRKKMLTLLGPNCDQSDQTCCEADFGSRIKISGHPLGQSASFFEIYLFGSVLVSPDGGDGANIMGVGQPGYAQGSLVQPCAGLGRGLSLVGLSLG